MANWDEIDALSAAPAAGDTLMILDVSDTSADAAGTNKQITVANFQSLLATVASAEDATDYSSTPYALASGSIQGVSFTGAQDQIVSIPTGVTGGPWMLFAPAANTLDIRPAVAVSLLKVAGDGNQMSGSVGIVPAGGSAFIWRTAANTFEMLAVTDADQVIAGALTVAGLLTATGGAELVKVSETSTEVTSASNAATIDLDDGTDFWHDLTEDVTYTFSNPATSGRVSSFGLEVIQDSSARAITWPAAVKWAGGTAPTLSAGSGDIDFFSFRTRDGGTSWLGFVGGQDFTVPA